MLGLVKTPRYTQRTHTELELKQGNFNHNDDLVSQVNIFNFENAVICGGV